MPPIHVILIGGTSHTGKTTLAAQFATKYGWEVCATDRLARHPGRPWRNDGTAVPPHVVEHYRSLAVDALLEDVLAHYHRLWPTIAALITRHATAPSGPGLVVEGSAVWPEFVATLTLETVAAIWLTASDADLQSRILEYVFSQRRPSTTGPMNAAPLRCGYCSTTRYRACAGLRCIHSNARNASSPHSHMGWISLPRSRR